MKSGKLVTRAQAMVRDVDAAVKQDTMKLYSYADFQNSLKRIAIYANKTTNQVVLDIQDKSLTVSAQDLDFSNEATEQIPCNYTGNPMKIAFNARFLGEMLGVLDTEEVKMDLSTPSRAGILTPVEEDNKDREILMLVMPVMLNN